MPNFDTDTIINLLFRLRSSPKSEPLHLRRTLFQWNLCITKYTPNTFFHLPSILLFPFLHNPPNIFTSSYAIIKRDYLLSKCHFFCQSFWIFSSVFASSSISFWIHKTIWISKSDQLFETPLDNSGSLGLHPPFLSILNRCPLDI